MRKVVILMVLAVLFCWVGQLRAQEIATILKEHGYTNNRTNNSVAARIADYLKEKGGIILE